MAAEMAGRGVPSPMTVAAPPATTFVVGAILAMAVGALATVPATAWTVLAVVAVAAGGVALLRWPALAPAVFWAVFCVQSTVFAQVEVTGIYYPLYAVMLVNLIAGLALARVRIAPRLLVAYGLFLLVVLVSLLATPAALGFAAYQRLFIYVLGLLVLMQFGSARQLRVLPWAQVLGTLTVSGWVVYSSFTTGFVHRAGIAADQNMVSFTIGFGILVLVSRLLTPGDGPLARLGTWLAVGLGTYAMLLLASRGVTVALAVTVLVLFARILGDVRRSVTLVVVAVALGFAVVALPGSDELLNRFEEANLSTANERLPLWEAALASIVEAGPLRVLAGQGFESSRDVILAVRPTTIAVHNAYLQVAVEFGLLGLAAFLALHLGLLARFWRSRSRLGLYAIGAITFMLMTNLSLDTPDGFLYWVALGYLMAMASFHQEFAVPQAAAAPPSPRAHGRPDSLA